MQGTIVTVQYPVRWRLSGAVAPELVMACLCFDGHRPEKYRNLAHDTA